MKTYVIYSSITHATSVKRALLSDPGLQLVHAPKGIPVNSCAYALFAPISRLEEIKDKSAQMGLPIRGVFNENFEELELRKE